MKTIKIFVLSFIISFSIFWGNSIFAQSENGTYSLEEVIQLAKENSIPAIRARHQYLLGYWRFRYFRSNYLPIVSLNTTPINFNRTVTQRFDVNQNIDVYLPQRNVQSTANLSLYQRIGLTGGSVFLDSDIGRLQNFGNNPFTNYSVTPLRLGLIQPLFGFNELKWEKQIEPLAFKLAKKRYISDLELVGLQALTYFFDLLNAQNDFDRASENLTIADTLLQIAEERLKIGTLTQDDVYELELSLLSSKSKQDQASIALLRAKTGLATFLGISPDQNLQLRLPDNTLAIQIDSDFALKLAMENAPDMLQGDYDKLVADQEADRTDKENRFNAEISASIGLNQSAEALSMAYGDLLDQEQIRISLNVPLLDWGRREGRFRMAQSQRNLINAEVDQARTEFQQELNILIKGFPLKVKQIQNNQESLSLSEKRFEITRQRFLLGNVDLLKLTSAIQAQNQAQVSYLGSLEDYWGNYYQIRQLTLYDFEKQVYLEIDNEEF